MVNVVIPVYNARDTLPSALDSLVAQTKKMFVVTLSQDGDGEDYSDIINEYKRRGLHIRHINGENGGPGVARQRGMDADNMCDYVMFLDADDMLMPNAIDTLYMEAKRNRLDVLSSDFLTEVNHQPNVYMSTIRLPVTWTHGKIYRVQYLRDNGIRFRDDLRLNEDAYFNLVAINSTKNKKKIQECTYLWRDNLNSLTRKDKDTNGGFFVKSWDQYVYGQVKALHKIYEITGELGTGLVGATLINIYKYMMQAKYFKYDTDEITKTIHELKLNPGIQRALDEPDFWKYIEENLKASVFFNNETLIFFDEKFSFWIRDNIQGEMYAYIRCERTTGRRENYV